MISRFIGRAASIAIGFFATACSDSPAPLPKSEVPTIVDPSIPFTSGTLAERIDAATRALEASPCRANAKDRATCAWSSFPLEPGPPRMAKNSGEAVLIMDSLRGGAPMFPFFRYANRLVGYYRVNELGGLDEMHNAAEMPTIMGNVLTSFADASFVPASALGRLQKALDPIESKVWAGPISHGAVTFYSLIDLVPEQPIVLVDVAYPFGNDPLHAEFCKAFSDPAARARIHERTEHLRDNLRAVMTKHNVHFVNASFGDSSRTMAGDAKDACAGLVPSPETLRDMLAQVKPLYEALFATPGVFAAHAAGDTGSEDAPFDLVTPDFPNRLKIGVAVAKNAGVDAEGRGDNAFVSAIETVPQRADGELFINHGCARGGDCGDAQQRLTQSLGLGDIAMPLAQPSWIAPLGLARFVNLRYSRHASEPMSDALIAQIKSEMTPRLCGPTGSDPCVIQDPIRHKQFETYRLGYWN
jgi:hypothetical protein